MNVTNSENRNASTFGKVNLAPAMSNTTCVVFGSILKLPDPSKQIENAVNAQMSFQRPRPDHGSTPTTPSCGQKAVGAKPVPQVTIPQDPRHHLATCRQTYPNPTMHFSFGD